MTELFLQILNMSISASWLILAVVALRPALRIANAPKWLNSVLWGIVGFRLIMPFSVESALSLIPTTETVPKELFLMEPTANPTANPAVNPKNAVLNIEVNPVIPGHFSSEIEMNTDRLQVIEEYASLVYAVGVAVMLIYVCISYLRLQNRMKTAVGLHDNIYQSEHVPSPFVLGFMRPRIYIPFNMSETDMGNVIAHEQMHIRRRDYLTKPLGFLLLSIHWFNPLLWASYILFCRDIELACDEQVIKTLGAEERADYSQSLLRLSAGHRAVTACPLAFGEIGVKERVKNVLNYKKPSLWIVAVALIVCIALILCFLTDPKTPAEPVPPGDTENTMSLRIVDGAGTGKLVLAGKEESDVYTLDLTGQDIKIYLDGKSAGVSALEDGMTADVSYEVIEAIYPAKFSNVDSISVYSPGTEKNPGGSFYDLSGLYLQVLNDLWEKDSGLNSGVSYISVDLSTAPGDLTDGEKSAIAYIFAGMHNAQGLNLSSDELKEQGYFTEVNTGGDSDKAPIYQWDDGILFSITGKNGEDVEIYSLPVIRFNAGKWRSPLGAYFFSACTAIWPEIGSWRSYSIGEEAIS